MRSALIPVLMPTGLPKRGLVCWHDLYDPTSSLASVPDLSGNGYSLQLGSDAGADSNDPAWGADGKGLVHTTDDYCLTGHLSGVTMAGDWTVLLCGLFNGTTSGRYMWSIGDGAGTNYCGVRDVGLGNIDVQHDSGTEASANSSDIAKSSISPTVLAITYIQGIPTLRRLDTGTSAVATQKALTGTPLITLCGVKGAANTNPDATTLYSHLFYNRALSLSELQRAYRYLKSLWATRNIQVL